MRSDLNGVSYVSDEGLHLWASRLPRCMRGSGIPGWNMRGATLVQIATMML